MHEHDGNHAERINSVREMFTHERDATRARVHELRLAQEQEAPAEPGDELDSARALEEVETHASLIERAEERLRAIESALSLLEQGRYGICAKCREAIPAQRLKAMPLAVYCVECQEKLDRGRHVGEGSVDEPFAHQWDVPEEMKEATETSRDEFVQLPQETAGEEELPLPVPEAAGAQPKPRKARRVKAAKPIPAKPRRPR